MKKRVGTLLLAITLFFGSFGALKVNKSQVAIAEAPGSILNYDASLGIFRDLTKEEVKAYYSSLPTGTKGNELLSLLQPILKNNQIKLKYDSGYTSSKAWDGYYLLDRDWAKSPLTESEISSQKYEKSNIYMNILYSTPSILIGSSINSGVFKYTNESNEEVTVSYKNGGAQFDREHVFPKSVGFNGEGSKYKDLTAGCDMQNLHAGEHVGNSIGHSNYPYGNVKVKDKSSEIVSAITGEVIGYTGNNEAGIKVFEPLDVDKGDIARTIFYMCARYNYYEDLGGGDETPALTLVNNANSSVTKEPIQTKDNPGEYGQLDDLLEWNKLDPVDEFEIHRNNLCYNAIQMNRNPFVDYPEWADVAFLSDSEVGIDLTNDDGIQLKKGLVVELPSLELYTTDNLDLTKFNFKFKQDNGTITDLSINDLAFELYFNNEKEDFDYTTYTFKKPGSYQLKCVFISGGESYENKIALRVLNRYSIDIIENNVISNTYFNGNSIDLSGLTIEIKDKTETRQLENYKVKIFDSDNKLVSEEMSYKFERSGRYTFQVYTIIDGEELTTDFSIEVGIDLSDDEIQLKKGLVVEFPDLELYTTDNLDLTKFNFKFKQDNGTITDLSINDLAFELYFNNEKEDFDYTTYTFKKPGSYQLKCVYISGGESYENKIALRVLNRYSIDIIENNVISNTYFKRKSIDLSGLTIAIKDKTETRQLEDYKVKIFDSDNKLVSEDMNYKFERSGRYTIQVYTIIDGEELTTDFSIIVFPSMITIILLAVLVLVIIIVILVVLKKNKKVAKKAKKYAKKYAKKKKR